MKKFLIAAVSVALFVGCSAPEGTFNLSIDIPEAGDSPVRISLEDNEVLFEGNLSNGKLDTDIDDILEQHVMVQIQELGTPGMYFHDGADVSIAFDTINGFQIKAGAFNDSVNVFNQRLEMFNNTMGMLEIKFRDAMTQNDTAAQGMIRTEAMNLLESQAKTVNKFAKRNDLLGAAIILSQNSSDITIEDYIAVRDQISEEYHDCPDYAKIEAKIAELSRSAVGTPFTDFYQATPDGDSLNILGVDGKYVLVDFWASWCRPCRAANPALVSLYNNYHDRGFNIVGISLDQDGAKWKSGIEEDGLPWPQVSDLQGWGNEISVYYAIQFIPQNLLLDDNGVIVGKNQTPEELAAFLENNL